MNDGMVWVIIEIKAIRFQPPCHMQGWYPQDQVAQGPIQPALEISHLYLYFKVTQQGQEGCVFPLELFYLSCIVSLTRTAFPPSRMARGTWLAFGISMGEFGSRLCRSGTTIGYRHIYEIIGNKKLYLL